MVAVFVVLAIIWLSQKPNNDGDWQVQYQRLPVVMLDGDTITVSNLRDFRYDTGDRVTQVRYVDREYHVSEFVAAWYGISHFGANGLAHVFLSFEFENQQYLTVSIEARLQKKHTDGYSPISGLLRAYNKMVVLATEQDVIGLRSHVRGERVHLYKLDVPDLYTIPLMLNFLREAQVLNREPEFYNTVTDNCMTGLLAESYQFESLLDWFDLRIMLPGNSDELAYELGFIDTSDNLQQLREKARVKPESFSINDPNFSRLIRGIN